MSRRRWIVSIGFATIASLAMIPGLANSAGPDRCHASRSVGGTWLRSGFAAVVGVTLLYPYFALDQRNRIPEHHRMAPLSQRNGCSHPAPSLGPHHSCAGGQDRSPPRQERAKSLGAYLTLIAVAAAGLQLFDPLLLMAVLLFLPPVRPP